MAVLATFYDHIKEIAKQENIPVVEAMKEAKALGIDEAVHAQACHDKHISQQVNGDIGVCVADRSVTGPKKIEHGTLYQKAGHCEQDPHQDHHDKGIAHDRFRLLFISPPPLNGA